VRFPENKLKSLLKSGRKAVGAFLMIPSVHLVEMLGYSGLDFVIIDAEHARPSIETLENMIRACEVSDTVPIVRIPNLTDRTHYIYALDSGAMGVQVPMVESRQMAEQAVRMAKYHPMGMRGLAGGRATKYGAIPLDEYVEQANEQTMVIAQVETAQGALCAGEIASVNGIDAVFIGPVDLSQSMGLPGRPSDARVQQAIYETAKRVTDVGTPVGSLTASAAEASKQLENRFQFMCVIPQFMQWKSVVDDIRSM